MRVTGICLFISTAALGIAGFSRFGPTNFLGGNAIVTLVLLAVAVACLGTLELKIHRRNRFAQRRSATALASALRNGALR